MHMKRWFKRFYRVASTIGFPSCVYIRLYSTMGSEAGTLWYIKNTKKSHTIIQVHDSRVDRIRRYVAITKYVITNHIMLGMLAQYLLAVIKMILCV